MIRLLHAFCALSLIATSFASVASDREAVISALHAYHRAVAENDSDRTAALVHADFIFSNSRLPRQGENDPLRARTSERLTHGSHLAEEPVARIVGDTAVVTGTLRARSSTTTSRDTVHGRFTTTWVKTEREWRLLAEQHSWDQLTPPTPPTPAPLFAANRTSTSTVPATASPTPATASLIPAATPARITPASIATEPTKVIDVTSAAATPVAATTAESEELRLHGGLLPRSFTRRFRAYEPNQIGYTWDEGDDGFMDFTFSTMFDLLSGDTAYPPVRRNDARATFDRKLAYSAPRLYFAGTIRAGQYIETRPSSPVVGKRFNPLLALRFWGVDAHGVKESEDNFFELVLGHESNGQFIASKERFDEQLAVYQNQARDARSVEDAILARNTAYRSTRDNLSRGWDYVGVQFARDWDSHVWWGSFRRPATMGLRAKFNYYLPTGPAQGKAEEFKSWEDQPDGKPRRQVDGLSLRYAMIVGRGPTDGARPWWSKIFRFDRRYALTVTTGYKDPFRFVTWKGEADVTLFNWLPMTVWYRRGYNSDLVDYYRRDHSLGFSLSFWSF